MAIREGSTVNGFGSKVVNPTTLVYGPPGSGKTHLWLTAPKPYGIVTNIREVKKAQLFRQDGPQFAVCETFEDVEQVVNGAYSGKYAKGAKTIALDNFTDLSVMVVEAVLRDASKSEMNQGLWGKAKDRLTALMRNITNLAPHMHVIVTAHEQIDKDDLRGDILGLPQTIGKLASYVGGFFDFFLYSKQEVYFKGGKPVPEYWVYTIDLGRFKASDHIHILESKEPNDYSLILGKFEQALTKTNTIEEKKNA